MSFKDVKPGTKVAKPVAARFITAKTGAMGIEVAFQFEEILESGVKQPERLNWVGWLSEKALENTMKTLVEVLGFNGDDTVDANGVLSNPAALAYDHEVSLVVELETNPNEVVPPGQQPKKFPRIKWVNKIGGSAFAGITPETVKNNLGAINFRAAYHAAKAGAGIKKDAPAGGPAPTQAADTGRAAAFGGAPIEDDLPF